MTTKRTRRAKLEQAGYTLAIKLAEANDVEEFVKVGTLLERMYWNDEQVKLRTTPQVKAKKAPAARAAMPVDERKADIRRRLDSLKPTAK